MKKNRDEGMIKLILLGAVVIIILILVILSGRGRPPYIGRVPQPA